MKELLAKRKAAQEKAAALHAKASAENRDLTADESTQFDASIAEVAALDVQIKRSKTLETAAAEQVTLEAAAAAVIPAASRQHVTGGAAAGRVGAGDVKTEFENLGEFMHAVRYNQNDARLKPNDIHGEQRMDTGSGGGFAVPKQFISTLRQTDPAQAIVRPRATVIPAGDPPDAEVSMPALDQSTTNAYGGATVNWISEGGAKPATGIALKEITLKPQECAAYVTVTDKLLRNWTAASSIIEQMLRGAVTSAEEKAFISGDGNGKPLGFLNSGSLIKVNRALANKVSFADIANLFSQIKFGPGMTFLYNQSLLPQLINLSDASGRIVWIPSAAEGVPPTLMGYPALPNERSPALGSLGDLVLAALPNYLIKDGSGPFVETSNHAQFTNNKTLVKITWNVDGQPWLNAPLKGEDGRSYSPFIALDVPSG